MKKNKEEYEINTFELNVEGFYPGITPKYTKHYSNGTEVRLHNRRIFVMPEEKGYQISVRFVHDNSFELVEAETQCYVMKHLRGKVWETVTTYRKETAAAISMALDFYEEQRQTFTWTKPKDEEE